MVPNSSAMAAAATSGRRVVSLRWGFGACRFLLRLSSSGIWGSIWLRQRERSNVVGNKEACQTTHCFFNISMNISSLCVSVRNKNRWSGSLLGHMESPESSALEPKQGNQSEPAGWLSRLVVFFIDKRHFSSLSVQFIPSASHCCALKWKHHDDGVWCHVSVMKAVTSNKLPIQLHWHWFCSQPLVITCQMHPWFPECNAASTSCFLSHLHRWSGGRCRHPAAREWSSDCVFWCTAEITWTACSCTTRETTSTATNASSSSCCLRLILALLLWFMIASSVFTSPWPPASTWPKSRLK